MSRHFRIALLATAATGLTGLAAADTDAVQNPDSVQVRSETVHFDAARIDDEQAAERLFFRIRHAAADVCRIASHPVGYELWAEHSCETGAVEEAVRATDIPELNEFYFTRR
jgi:UrcA family protein